MNEQYSHTRRAIKKVVTERVKEWTDGKIHGVDLLMSIVPLIEEEFSLLTGKEYKYCGKAGEKK